MTHPVLLAIECSQQVGGIALLHSDGSVRSQRFETGTRHDDVLMPSIEAMLSEADCAAGDLEGCGVSIGPGGFTGLRISVSTVMTMGMALDIPVYGIPSALVVATSLDAVPDSSTQLLVTLAGKGETAWFTLLSGSENGHWIIQQPGALVDGNDAGPWLKDASLLLADEHLPEVIRTKAEEAGLPVEAPLWDPEACLAITRMRHGAGMGEDPRTLQPIYARQPDAVSQWESRTRR